MHYVKLFNINGVDTKQVACIELQGPPNAATEGAVGVLGMDVSSPTHEVYRCVAVNGSVYTWELLSAGMSIISATITGEGGMSKVFSYDTLRIPNNYLIKPGDLILDSEGYLYQVNSIGGDACDTTYCGTHIGGIPSGDKDCTIVVKDGKLQLVTESGSVLSEVEFLTSDEETIYRNPNDGVAQVRAIKTVNDTLLHLFMGTQAEYDNLPDYNKENLFAIITDDTAKERIEESIEAVDAKVDAVTERVDNVYTGAFADTAEDVISNINGEVNLFDFQKWVKVTGVANGSAVVNSTYGSIMLSSTANDNHAFITEDNKIKLKPNTTYTLSAKSQKGGEIFVAFETEHIESGSMVNPHITFTTPSNGVVKHFRIDNDVTGETNTFSKFMLTEGDKVLPYTPFEGGEIARKNGNYPNMTVGNATGADNLLKGLVSANATLLPITESGFYVFYVDTGLSTVGDVSLALYIDASRSTRKSALLADSTTGVSSTYTILEYSSLSNNVYARMHSNGSYQQGYLTIKGYIKIC